MNIFKEYKYQQHYSLLYESWTEMISTEYSFFFTKIIDDFYNKLKVLEKEREC